MVSGVKTLHQIDRAIQQARYDVGKASELPARISKSLIEIRGREASALEAMAKLRLDLLAGEGAASSDTPDQDLGYVDRQASKLLAEHSKAEQSLLKRAEQAAQDITDLEARRREQESLVAKAVKAYEQGALACQKKLVKDPGYIALLTDVERLEATQDRAAQKLDLARGDEQEKGALYRDDPFFAYLQKRRYGQDKPKGWFLTRALDRWVAGKVDYATAAVNYRRLQDIPRRLKGHLDALERQTEAAREALKQAEEDMLISEGVEALRKASIFEQTQLEKLDAKIETAEHEHQDLRAELSQITAGTSGPYQEALRLLADTLARRNLPDLKVLAAQTRSYADDEAVDQLSTLRDHGADLDRDHHEATKLLEEYRKGLAELEAVRRQFKSRRYDAPYSQFPSGSDMIGALIGQVLAGVLSGNDLWRKIERAQRTIKRGTDIDFGGVDWGEAMRLPRSNRGKISIDIEDIFGGSSRRRSSPPRSRTSRSRMPRSRSSRRSSRRSSGRSRGGFKTGGGF